MDEGNELVKVRFFIEPKEEHNRVQHIGLRLVVTEKIIPAGFERGMVFNLPDGTVEVALEGNKMDIQLFHKNLKENLIYWLEEKTTNKEALKQMIGNPGICITDLEYKKNLCVLDVGLYSHSLEMNQFSKGIDIFYELTAAIKDLRDTLKAQR